MEWVVNATPRTLYPRERPGAHCIGGWVGPRAVWTGALQDCPAPSLYTDYAIPAPYI